MRHRDAIADAVTVAADATAEAAEAAEAAAEVAQPESRPQFYCTLCSVLCRDPEMWHTHQNGQMRRKRCALQTSQTRQTSVSHANAPPAPPVVELLHAYQNPPGDLAAAVIETAHRLRLRHTAVYSVRGSSSSDSSAHAIRDQHIRWAIWEMCRRLVCRAIGATAPDSPDTSHLHTSPGVGGVGGVGVVGVGWAGCPGVPFHVIQKSDQMIHGRAAAVQAHYRPHHRHPAWVEDVLTCLGPP